jgi:GNAT superfamily N-acetyltransferase
MTSSYTITPARAIDLPWIAGIELCAARLLSGHAPESVLREVTSLVELREAQALGHLWVALGDDGPVGFAHVKMLETDRAHLDELDVHPDHGRRGLGRGLVRTVCDWAAAEGLGAVTLSTFREVPFNRPFYASLGFEEILPHDVTPALAAVREHERVRGLDLERRLLMLRPLRPSAAP